ncbi:MAG: DUF58 domain-containing protein [Anaerolineae bacterium]|nr:DUF58 domain-containing protein [Anaerolineae bacterium]
MQNGDPTTTLRLNSPWLPVLLLLLVFLQATNPSPVWQYMLTGVLLANAVSYYWARQLRSSLTVQRRVLWAWAQVGDMLEEEFVIENRSWLPVVWAEVADHSTVPGHDVSRVESVPGRGRRTWRARSVCRLRGHFQLGPWELRTGDPFAVFSVVHHIPDVREIVVFPPVVRVPQLSLPRGVASGTSRSLARAQETTVDVAGVRPYVPGDSLSHVHWPTTARMRGLFVKQFDREPSGSLWILLDLESAVQAGEGEESTAEYGVIVAASLAHMVLRDNRPVGLFCTGRSRVMIRPNTGMQHTWAIMRALTSVQPGDGVPLAVALEEWSRIASRDSSLAVITPATTQEWLSPLMRVAARGLVAGVTLLDAASFDGVPRPLAALVSALAELRVSARTVSSGMQFEHLVPLAYRGVLRFKVGGTGRAIAIREPASAGTGMP